MKAKKLVKVIFCTEELVVVEKRKFKWPRSSRPFRLQDLAMDKATDNFAEMRIALQLTQAVFEDIAMIIRRDGPYPNAGFLDATAARIARVLAGGKYGDGV